MGYQLFAANNTLINTYGYLPISLDLRLRRDIVWRFVEADVNKPIIGADLLHHYSLLPDLRNSRIIDSKTGLTSGGHWSNPGMCSVRIQAANETSPFDTLLKQFPSITKPEGLLKNVKHNTVHHIRTTPGPPVTARARRLAPDKLAIAKAEFSNMGSAASHDAARAQGHHHFI